MRQTSAPKQRHEGGLERRDALKEVGQRPFPADGIPHQRPEKVDGLIAAEASSYQAHLLGESLQQPLRLQVTGHHDHFREPVRHRRTIKRRGLNLDTPIGYHRQRDLLVREDFVTFPLEISLSFFR